MKCSDCGADLSPRDPNVWQKVLGWEQHRRGGGTNAVALRRPLQEWLCGTCMIGRKSKTNRGQGSLL